MTVHTEPDFVRICPQCASVAVDWSPLHGGQARCRGCLWTGTREELLNLPVANGGEEWTASVINDLRRILSGELGVPYLKFLLRWGFIAGDEHHIAGTLDRKVFARYLAGIGAAIIKSIFTIRAELEVERIRAEKAAEATQ